MSFTSDGFDSNNQLAPAEFIPAARYANQHLPPQFELAWFYADWCGHCKDFAPRWKALKADERIGHIQLVAYDGDDPDCAAKKTKYEIRGYPTLVLIRPNRSFETFRGERTKDSIIRFVLKHASS